MRYSVSGKITVSTYTVVEASSPEEAQRIASDRQPVLCPEGPGRVGTSDRDIFVIESADGEVEITDVVAMDVA